jgi:hypothetical protein
VGTDPDSFTLFPISATVGLLHSSAYAVVDDALFWWDNATQATYRFDGAKFDRIDDPIRRHISNNIDYPTGNRHFKAKAFANDGKFYLSVAWTSGGGGTDNTTNEMFVYDTRSKTWTQYDVGFQDALVGPNSTVYAVGPNHQGETPATGVFQAFNLSHVDDNGTAIDAHFHIPWWAPENMMQDFRIRKLQIYTPGEATNPATLGIKYHADFDGTTEVGSASHSNSGTTDYVLGEYQGFDAVNKAISIHVENDSADEWQVDRLDLLVSSRRNERNTD